MLNNKIKIKEGIVYKDNFGTLFKLSKYKKEYIINYIDNNLNPPSLEKAQQAINKNLGISSVIKAKVNSTNTLNQILNTPMPSVAWPTTNIIRDSGGKVVEVQINLPNNYLDKKWFYKNCTIANEMEQILYG